MSYSFAITAASKDEAGKKVEEELGKVVEAQPVHEHDRQAAQDAAEAFINALAEPGEEQQIAVSVSGSLGWTDETARNFTSTSVSVYARIEAKT
jgi:hypothetical protein